MAHALIPVSVIASDICSEEIGDSKAKMAILKYVAKGFRELHLFVSHATNPKTVYLNADHSVNLPCAFVYITKVGIGLEDGRTITLWQNYSQVKLKDRATSVCVEEIQSIINGTVNPFNPDEIVPFYGFNGDQVLNGMGLGYPIKGFYDIDTTEGVISLGSLWPEGTKIVIEYKDDGISGGLKFIPAEMENAVTFYALWRWYKNKNRALAADNWNDWLTAYGRVKILYNTKPFDYYGALFQNTVRETV